MSLKRLFDIILSSLFMIIFSPIFLIIFLFVLLETKRSPFHYSKRIGKDNVIFKMLKFKTMRDNTPHVATHLLANPEKYVTKSGKFLRRTSLDELPQLLSIFLGKMSFVGPRPALFNQEDLIKLRFEKKIHKILPGLTGYAQINGRDNLSIKEKVFYDEYYMNNNNFFFDIKIIILTFLKLFKNKDVHH